MPAGGSKEMEGVVHTQGLSKQTMPVAMVSDYS